MIKAVSTLLAWVIFACVLLVQQKLLKKKLNKICRITLLVLTFCAAFLAFSISAFVVPLDRTVTLRALEEKNESSANSQIYLTGFQVDGKKLELETPVKGQWVRYKNMYCWFEESDERWQEGTTNEVIFCIQIGADTSVIFTGDKWKGKVKVQVDQESFIVDTFLATEKSDAVEISLPSIPKAKLVKLAAASVAIFLISFLLIASIFMLLVFFGQWIGKKTLYRHKREGPLKKLLGYQFLFEELVARDFKKKYKRTVLGMAWSVLAPLLQLLVMWLVFSQFFGKNTAHYVVYIFAGNIVYSYFSESTNSGMSSLMANASIFSKVNVPKYLFLFSKNISSLINFSLTLLVFFVFVYVDGIAFTWKYCFLIFPIICIIFFNLGVGLILSAMFVFFKDIQYLWSVFLQLLMYLSAIFYTIDGYSQTARNLFLLNPIYLYIRYFRKIVIEATIPTVWFHLVAFGYAAIAFVCGCYMYKKYNTKFLYYV